MPQMNGQVQGGASVHPLRASSNDSDTDKYDVSGCKPAGHPLTLRLPVAAAAGTGARTVWLPAPPATAEAVTSAIAAELGLAQFELVAHGAGPARHPLSEAPLEALAALRRPHAVCTIIPKLVSGRTADVAAPPAVQCLDLTDRDMLKQLLDAMPADGAPGGAQLTLQLQTAPGPDGAPGRTMSVPICLQQLRATLDAGASTAAAPPGGAAAMLAALLADGGISGNTSAAELGAAPAPAPGASNIAPASMVEMPPWLAPSDGGSAEAQQRRHYAMAEEGKRKNRRRRENIRTARTMEMLRDKKDAQLRKRERRKRERRQAAGAGGGGGNKVALAEVDGPSAAAAGRFSSAATAESHVAKSANQAAARAFGFKRGFLL